MPTSVRNWPAITLAAIVLAAVSTPRLVAQDRQSSREQVRLQYTFNVQQAERAVDVVVRIDGLRPERDELDLKMPRGYAFIKLPEPPLAEPVRVFADKEELEVTQTWPYAWTTKSAGHSTVEVRYRVLLTHREHEAVRGRHDYEHPFLDKTHGLLPTGALVIYPKGVEVTERRVRLNVPDGWRIIAPWPQTAPAEFAPPSHTALRNDLIAIGAWNTHEIRVGDFLGTIAFVPGQEKIETKAAAMIRDIVEYELKLFDRPAAGNFLFLFGPPIKSSMAGSPKTHSMIMAVDPRLVLSGKRHISHLVAHEFFHTWAAAEAHMADELRWINEGFTDYYAYLVPARLGLISWDEFADSLSECMGQAHANPHCGKMSLADAGGPVFFSDRDADQLIYVGGRTLAAWLDQAIRKAGHGKTLDDFMHALINDPHWDAYEHGPNIADVVTLTEKFTSPEIAKRLEAAAREPYAFDPAAEFAKLGITIERTVGPPDLSLRANLDGTRIIDMDPKDVAHRIGLRPNDRLLRINGRRVKTPFDVHAAWRRPTRQRVRVVLKRGDEKIKIDEPLPEITEFKVPADPWREPPLTTTQTAP